MTTVTHVSAKEMKERTGFKHALGYSLPEEDEILVRKGLSKKVKKEVLAHEEEHIANDEEGPFLGSIIGGIGGFLLGGPAGAVVGAGLGSTVDQSRQIDKATKAQVDSSDAEIAYAKETRDLIRKDQAPYREAGYTALDALMSMTGLSGTGAAPVSRRRSGVFDGAIAPIRRLGGGRRRQTGGGRGSSYRVMHKAHGGETHGGQMYNINEVGPENFYSKGKVTRGKGPVTIDGETGYVEPHIQGRALGGYTGMAFGPEFISGNRLQGNTANSTAVNPQGNTANSTAVNPRTGYPVENPGGVEGGYNFKTDPGYQFRFEEGMRALDRSAAMRGGLLSGGTVRKAIRYGQGMASDEYANVYNRISNIAGLGTVANQVGANAALATSGQVGGALQNQGYARASGYTAQGNLYGTAINEIAKLPWDKWGVFGGRGGGSSPGIPNPTNPNQY
jgi:hypothetical protein